MAEAFSKVGIISCSGEEIPEGTVARQAVRRVLEALRPQQTVTLCLPLFLAGEEGERRFAREHPTITVDGCSKLCAKRGTEKYSGQVSASLVVSDILGDRAKGCHRSTRDADKADEEAVWLVAERIASEVDALAGSASPRGAKRCSGRRCRLLCLQQPVAGWKAGDQGKAGRNHRSAVDLPAASEEGAGAGRRLRRHVAENGQDLSFHRRPRGSGLSRCTCGGIPRVLSSDSREAEQA